MDWVDSESLATAEPPKTETNIEIKNKKCEWKKWVTLGLICICAIIAWKAKEIVHFCINSFNDLKHRLYKPSAPAKAISKDELMHDYLTTQSFDVLNEMEEMSVNCEISENAAKIHSHDTQLLEINEDDDEVQVIYNKQNHEQINGDDDEVQVLHQQIKTDSTTQHQHVIEEVKTEDCRDANEDAACGDAEDGMHADAEGLVNIRVQEVTGADDEAQISEKKPRKRKPKAT